MPPLHFSKPLTRWWTDGRHGRPHSHLSAHSAPLHLSAPISRWAEHGAATCRPRCFTGTSPKSCHGQHFPKPLLLIHPFTVNTVLMCVNHSNGLASALSQCGSCLRGLRKQMDGHADWCGFINSPRDRSKLCRPCTSHSGALRTEPSQTWGLWGGGAGLHSWRLWRCLLIWKLRCGQGVSLWLINVEVKQWDFL